MRLIRLSAHFGVLDGAEIGFAPGRLQLVVDGNERGKSTLVAAIVAALYGLAPGNRGTPPESHRYRPLTGDRFDVELDLEDGGGRRLRVRRDLLQGACTVADLDRVQDVTAAFATGKSAWEVGRVLLGLSREQFLRSALVRQGEVAALALDRDAAALTTRIQQLVDSSAGDATADAAIGLLGEALRGYQGSMHKGPVIVANEIRALEERIATLQRRLSDLAEERAAQDAGARQLEELNARAEALRVERTRAARLALRAEAEDAAARLARDDERRARRDRLAARRASLAQLPEATPELVERLAALDGAIVRHDLIVQEAAQAATAGEERLRQASAALTGRERLAEATPDDAALLLRAAERLERAIAGVAGAEEEQRAAQARLGAEDRELERRFAALSAEERETLDRHGERHAALQAALDAARRLAADAADRERRAALLEEQRALAAVADADPARGNALAALDATIRAREERLAEAETNLAEAIERRREIAIRAASRAHLEAATAESVEEVLRAQDRLQQAERAEQAAILDRTTAEAQAGPTDRDLQRRFGSRPREELEELARYPQRRADLHSLLEERETPAGAPPSRRRPLWLGAGLLLALAGVALATRQPFAGVPLVALGLALAAAGLLRRGVEPPPQDVPFLRGEAQRRLQALDDRAFVVATGLGYRSPGEAIGALQAWQDANARLEQRLPLRRIEEARERLADERREAGRVLARWGWSAGRGGATAEMLAALYQEMTAHLQDRGALERYTKAEEGARRRVEQVAQQRDAERRAFAERAGAPAGNAAERAAAIEAVRSGLSQRERREALAAQLAELSSRLLGDGERERLVAVLAAAGEPAGAETADLDATAGRVAQALAAEDARAAELAARAGFPQASAAAEALRGWMQARPELQALAGAEARLAEASASLLAERGEAARLLGRWGEAVPSERADAARLLALHDALLQAMQDVAALTAAREAAEQAVAQLATAQAARGADVAAFLAAAGTPGETAGERAAALERVRQMLAGAEERRLAESRAAEVSESLLSDEERERLQAAVAANARAEPPPFPAAPRPAAAYRDEAERRGAEAEAVEREAAALRERIGAVLDRYEREYPVLEAELWERQAALARTRGFADAAGLAREVLQDVARDVHRDWSARLNAATGDLLDRFAGEHLEIRFGEQLDFVVRDPATGREWPRAAVERRLSAGARDQIYLAIRLALAGLFSAEGVSLPLILDDPLVTSDDERFVAAMAYLAEQATNRQVIVLTCHAERHRWLLERHPEIAARVQTLGWCPVKWCN